MDLNDGKVQTQYEGYTRRLDIVETLKADFEDTSRSGLKNNLKTAQEELVTVLTFLHQGNIIPEIHPLTGTYFHEREDEAHILKVHKFIHVHTMAISNTNATHPTQHACDMYMPHRFLMRFCVLLRGLLVVYEMVDQKRYRLNILWKQLRILIPS